MRILHCIPSLAGGGAERQLCYLAEGLATLGVDNHVAFVRRGENFHRLESSGAGLHEIPVRGNHSLALPLALHHLIRRLQPTVVQTWLPKMDIVAGAVALWNRVPWVLSERNSAVSYGHTFKDRLRLRLGACATAVVANSATGLAYWEHRLSPTTNKQVIQNALPLGEIGGCSPLSNDPENLCDGAPIVLYAGRLHPSKNLDALLLAFREIRDRIAFKAVLCGQGPYQSTVEERIARLGLEQHVVLKGYVSNVWSWMKRASVFVSVSFTEGQPNTVMEAMACRCPLVVSSIPEHREFLDDGSARLVEPHDPTQIASAIAQALSNPIEAARRAEIAAARAEKWSVASMANHYATLYRMLLEQRSGVPSTAGDWPLRHPAPNRMEAPTV